MKIALLGTGKTGSHVADLHTETVFFNSKNQPTLEKLKECDIIISFLAGDIFETYIPLLLESKLPVITGSTGFEWKTSDLDQINANKVTWVRAHNFSLGMNIVKSMIETLSKASTLYPEASFHIHDIHHIHKKDAPSGTALSWEKWLGQKADITAERTGDVVGYHHMEMDTPVEKIKITHEAKDRAIFAKGAIWAAQQVLSKDQNKNRGLIEFSSLVQETLSL